MKSCQVFFKHSTAFVYTQCTTEHGLGVTTAPMLKAQAADAMELGSAVVTCLEASRDGIPTPQDFPAIAKQMFQFAGEKSWSRFARGAILRAVWLEGTRARIVPYVAAERGSFDLREDQSAYCAYEPLEIGQCLLKSLGQ